jgi:DNA replication protein DnaD
MTSAILSESAKQIVGAMRELIEKKIATKEEKVNKTATKEEKVGDVWKYAGREISHELSKLEEEIRKDGNKVSNSEPSQCAPLIGS